VIASHTAVSLSDAREESQFGGKAVQLGAALRSGLPVPPGLAITAELAAAVAAHEPAAIVVIRELFSSIDPPLAVRSSCVGEDSAGASFAGQHHTTLGVSTLEQLTDAINAVWRSARSEAALAYRRKLGLGETSRMAVVIQQLVEPDVAGVMFTRNPVTGADERLIEAAWGLGEVVVQGLVTPDTYRLSRTGEVLDRTGGHKDRALRYQPDGGTAFEPIPPDLAGALCLNDAELSLLHDLARRCEQSFQGPSDIEWALADETAYLLQRRPITKVSSWPLSSAN
jgi:pyruvate,water dikinase